MPTPPPGPSDTDLLLFLFLFLPRRHLLLPMSQHPFSIPPLPLALRRPERRRRVDQTEPRRPFFAARSRETGSHTTFASFGVKRQTPPHTTSPRSNHAASALASLQPASSLGKRSRSLSICTCPAATAPKFNTPAFSTRLLLCQDWRHYDTPI